MRVGAALIAARDSNQDAVDAIATVVPGTASARPWRKLKHWHDPKSFDAYQMLGEHYAGVRRWAPAFLDAFVFQSVPAAAQLMRAIDLPRGVNRGLARSAEIRADQRG
jgi:hypothetical protein